MASADTLKRLCGPLALSTTAATVYTEPGNGVTVLRDIHVCNESATTVKFTLSIGSDAAGKRLWKDLDIPAGGAFDWSGSFILETTELIQAKASIVASLTLAISGIESS